MINLKHVALNYCFQSITERSRGLLVINGGLVTYLYRRMAVSENPSTGGVHHCQVIEG